MTRENIKYSMFTINRERKFCYLHHNMANDGAVLRQGCCEATKIAGSAQLSCEVVGRLFQGFKSHFGTIGEHKQ